MKIEDLYNVQTQNDIPTATDTQYELAIEFVEKYCTDELNNRAKMFVQDNDFRQTDLYNAMNYHRDVWLTGKFIAFRDSKYGNDLINKFIG